MRNMSQKIIMRVTFFILLMQTLSAVFAENTVLTQNMILSDSMKKDIDSFIQKQMEESKIPGLSVVIIKGDQTVYRNGFGFANKDSKKPVTSDTLFELGSNSKAFTALAIFILQEKGLLHIDDPVSKYIPWFKVHFKNREEVITIKHLLYQTSGIPFKTIGSIPQSNSPDALEKTVRTLINIELDHMPGDKFMYATINYDVLGYIIEQVSGNSYEEFMKEEILSPLELNNTYLFRDDAIRDKMASGYKISFLRASEYEAPVFRGNTPAGYIITNITDMSRWLKIQLNSQKPGTINPELIQATHLPDRTVSPGPDGSSYGAGWMVFQSGGGEIAHGGSNPNFSSFIMLRTDEKIGVAVLANLNSAYTQNIALEITHKLLNKEYSAKPTDLFKRIDQISVTIFCVLLSLIFLILTLSGLLVYQFITGRRRLQLNIVKILIGIPASILFTAILGYSLYRLPNVLFGGLPWSFVKVWGPESLILMTFSIVIGALLFCLYFVTNSIFTRDNKISFIPLVIISVVSGFGNALIIFVINETLSRNSGFESGLLLFFLLGIAIYVVGQKLVRTRMINITNGIIYSKRIDLIDKITATSFQSLESVEDGKIHAGLNNDTETISNFANAFINCITSIVTLVFCFIYLGIISFFGFLISLFVIFLAVALYFFVSRSANMTWEKTRDIQNVFFKFINDLLRGFKELRINNQKQNEFKKDMKESCKNYKETKRIGDLKFTNAFIVGELLFIFVIGAVAFLFPLIFKEIHSDTLRNYVFVFLYMTGPIHGILNSVPNIVQARISWNRINELSKQLSLLENKKLGTPEAVQSSESVNLQLQDVEYTYKNENGETFSVGPVNYTFKAGEIVFITGGNGSGKSTLAKLITGLYAPDKGTITINGDALHTDIDPGHNYSAIFSDYHLFDKLYGIDHLDKEVEIEKYLKILQIDEKLSIKNGEVSTIKLSSGQRKRLALLISYLEDKPICLFDEWAADQDPDFRKFFYNTLLTELKQSGKCIISITHDDTYFHVADRVIKMELGKILESGSKE